MNTPGQVALAWVVQPPGVTSPIIDPRTLAQLEDRLGGVRVRLTAEDRARLDAVTSPGRIMLTVPVLSCGIVSEDRSRPTLSTPLLGVSRLFTARISQSTAPDGGTLTPDR
jgi:Aldo/keto reductase family